MAVQIILEYYYYKWSYVYPDTWSWQADDSS